MAFLKKHSDIIVIVSVIVICVVVALCITFSGLKNGDYDYVAIKVNPEVEFVTNKDTTVKSVKPLNEDGQIVISGEDFVGLKVKDAVKKYLTLCCKCGYLDVEATEENSKNAIKMTVVSGITNSLELGVYESISKFLKDNTIFGVIVENEKDFQTIKTGKEQGISSPDKMELINTILSSDENIKFSDIKGKTEEELIDKIIEIHEKYENVDMSEEKNNLLSINESKYDEHIAKIDNKAKRAFNEKYSKYVKMNTNQYETAFNDKYSEYISELYG